MNTEMEDANPELHRTFEIVINGELHVVQQHKLTFEDIVRLAFTDAVFNDDIVYTVTYKRGPKQNREGSLVAGESVVIKNGMIFNAKRTDKS
jgi:ketosteroid isomerase-like protein